MTTLSAALTFPLTCAYAWRDLAPEGLCTRLCVVGARAEATLPLVIWRELSELSQAEVTVDMLGPAAKTTPQELMESGRGRISIEQSCKPDLFHRSELGRALASQSRADSENLPDAFALFNPGFGEPGWERAWRPTVEALFASRRPVVLTALSPADAGRDALFWARTTGAEINYGSNPWCSLLVEEETGSRSNCMIAIWQPN